MLFTFSEDVKTITYDEAYQIVEYTNGKIKKYKLLKHMPALLVAAILYKSDFEVETVDRVVKLVNIPIMLSCLNETDLYNGYNKFILNQKKFGNVDMFENQAVKDILQGEIV